MTERGTETEKGEVDTDEVDAEGAMEGLEERIDLGCFDPTGSKRPSILSMREVKACTADKIDFNVSELESGN